MIREQPEPAIPEARHHALAGDAMSFDGMQ